MDGTTHVPPSSSSTKKAAKAEATSWCLKQLGLLKAEEIEQEEVEEGEKEDVLA